MKKRAVTLLEVMIVIFLITLITGAIGYNMKGAMEKGKAFRTERAIEQLKELLHLRAAEMGSYTAPLQSLEETVEASGLVKKPRDLLYDGWGEKFEITMTRKKDDYTITSKKLEDYNRRHYKVAPGTNLSSDDDI